MKTALITGITGQDGSYLAEFLQAKGYAVHGMVRRTSNPPARIAHLTVPLHYGDMTDGSSLAAVLRTVQPDEVYNLAAQSDVAASFNIPEYTADTDALGALRLLEVIRGMAKPPRFYQAGSSEMFGDSPPPQSESTPFRSRSPYAAAKVFAHHIVADYREAYGIHASNGILFNHESPRRGDMFVTQKIAKAVHRDEPLYLGNLDARRDWGWAPEYVEAMWLMLQQQDPDDYVIATGESHSVADFAEYAYDRVGRDWRDYVDVDVSLFRPTEVPDLRGDYTKAAHVLNWTPRVQFCELVRRMVDAAA